MASDMIADQHNCEGLLKFILCDDMVNGPRSNDFDRGLCVWKR